MQKHAYRDPILKNFLGEFSKTSLFPERYSIPSRTPGSRVLLLRMPRELLRLNSQKQPCNYSSRNLLKLLPESIELTVPGI